MNAITKHEAAALPALQMNEAELIKVLQTSMYPGASIESIKMVLGYCKATSLDPMQKPVHIVPMSVSSGKKNDKGWDIKETRDVIMPGVGLYRSQAAKTGEYVGMSEPTFGPTRKLAYQAVRWTDDGGRRQKSMHEETIEYPEWCSITVRRSVNGIVCEFPAREYWLENYATKGSDSSEPNAMWKKRPFGQISKCAEAQALRKAFPGETGSQPTAEEMEGKATMDDVNDGRTIDVKASEVKAEPQPYPQEQFDKLLPSWRDAIAKGKATADAVIAKAGSKHPLTDDQKAAIRAPVAEDSKQSVDDAAPKITYAQVASALNAAKDLDALAAAADLIGEVADEVQRGELRAIFDTRNNELGA